MEPHGMASAAQRPPGPDLTAGRQRGRGLAILLFLWIVFIAYAAQGSAWFAPALGLGIRGTRLAAIATAAQALALLVPLFPLALLWRAPRYRALFRAWLLAALLLLPLAPIRLLPPTEGQLITLLQAGVIASYLAIGSAFAGRQAAAGRGEFAAGSPQGEGGSLAAIPGVHLPAAAAALLTALPWIAWGAVGSPLDIALTLALALLMGVATGRLIAPWLASREETASRRLSTLTGGLAVGALLLIVASGLSFNGAQLPLMLALPAAGWAALALARVTQGRQMRRGLAPTALLVGLSAAAPLLFTDPDGMALIVRDPILEWAFLAALASAAIAALIGLLITLLARRPARLAAGPAWGATLIVLLAAGGLIYATGGQGGAHGDMLFAVLKEQADLSGAPAIADVTARRAYVYSTLTGHAERSQADLRAALDRLGVRSRPYYLVNAIEVRGGLPLRLWLEARPEVDRVLPGPALRPPQEPPSPASGHAERPSEPPWNLKAIGADRVWRELGVTGAGITVGQSDSGAQHDHPELAANYRGRDGAHAYNWYDPWAGTAAPTDAGGHGTHTLGSILGQNVGVAPGATWFACANLPRNLGNPARYLDCLQFMLAPFPQDGDPFRDGDPALAADVINNSWGCPQDLEGCDPGSLLPAVRALTAAGIFVVASAGNDGPACSSLTDPIAIYDEVLTVGAVDEQGDLALFSSRGPVTVDGSGRTKPDLVAPGVDVLSAFPGDTYARQSGTSMAGPHVVGVVALMWSANRGLIGDIARTREILLRSARPFTGTVEPTAACPIGADPGAVPSNVTGYGVVDAYAAVKMALDQKP